MNKLYELVLEETKGLTESEYKGLINEYIKNLLTFLPSEYEHIS